MTQKRQKPGRAAASAPSGQTLAARLAGGDKRSVGRASEVLELLHAAPDRLPEIVAGLENDDGLVRMRCADVLEKVSRDRPDLVRPFRARLLIFARAAESKELKWHAAQMLPRLKLSAAERASAIALLRAYMTDPSRIVQVSALQALVEFALEDPRLVSRVRPLIIASSRAASPALRARARKLRALLD